MGAAAPTAGTWEGLGRVGLGGGAAWVAEVGGMRVGMRLEGIWLPPPSFWGASTLFTQFPAAGERRVGRRRRGLERARLAQSPTAVAYSRGSSLSHAHSVHPLGKCFSPGHTRGWTWVLSLLASPQETG